MGPGKVRFCHTDFDCVDDYPVDTKIEAMVRPENVHLVPVSEGMLTGNVYSSIFKGVYYEILIMCGKYEFTAQSQKEIPEGTNVGISMDPGGIHVVPYNIHKNHFAGTIDEELSYEFTKQIIPEEAGTIYMWIPRFAYRIRSRRTTNRWKQSRDRKSVV